MDPLLNTATNPSALITGGSRGIGRGIALELARLGWDLMINYAGNRSAAESAATDCQAAARHAGRTLRVEIFAADISRPEDRNGLLEAVRDRFGRLDLLVNNAGIASLKRVDLLEASEESFDRVMAVNLRGPFFLTQQASRWMIEQAKHGSQPKIVNISSISAYTASVSRADYCLSKAGLSMVTQVFAARLAEHGIQVFEIRPGIIATDMTAPVRDKYDSLIRDGLTPIRRWGTPEDVGKAVSAIAQGLLPFSTGEVLNVDGGFHLRRL